MDSIRSSVISAASLRSSSVLNSHEAAAYDSSVIDGTIQSLELSMKSAKEQVEEDKKNSFVVDDYSIFQSVTKENKMKSVVMPSSEYASIFDSLKEKKKAAVAATSVAAAEDTL